MQNKKSCLITGASGGFGGLTVRTLAKEGYTVFASMRDPGGKNAGKARELQAWARENAADVKLLELDVTDDNSVRDAVKKALAAAGKLDVVVNNAGVGTLGLQEGFTADDWRRLFDVNVFGMQRVDRAVLPQMRERGSGLLIHISSLLGRMILPFYGPYNASKWAVEALAETYRVELSGLGIDVCTVEPGGYPTTFMENLMKPGDPSRDAGYGKLAEAPGQMFESFKQALKAAPAQKPQNVADAIARLINTPAGQRPGRTVVDTMGMGDPIKGYNEQLDRITAGTYGAFGMGNMLKVKVTADV